MAWTKPVPFIDNDIAPFYEGLKQHKFLMLQCTTCGAWYWPAAYCRFHENQPFMREMEWREASGLGTIATYNVHYTAFNPAFRDDVPYIFAMAQMDEGPMFGSTVENCTQEEMHVGMRVEVIFDDQPELGLTLPRLQPVREQSNDNG